MADHVVRVDGEGVFIINVKLNMHDGSTIYISPIIAVRRDIDFSNALETYIDSIYGPTLDSYELLSFKKLDVSDYYNYGF